MTVPSIIPPKPDALLQVKYTASQKLLEQYIALEQMREVQIDLLHQLIQYKSRLNSRLLGMLLASVIVNLYLVYRFF
jgi:hypothetical protein